MSVVALPRRRRFLGHDTYGRRSRLSVSSFQRSLSDFPIRERRTIRRICLIPVGFPFGPDG